MLELFTIGRVRTGCVLVFILWLAGSSCTSDLEPDISGVGYDYFPLDSGSYIDYSVSQTNYTPNGGVVSDEYQLRVLVADMFENEGGSTTYILYRYRRPDENAEWEFHSTWSARREEIRGITVEGNVPYQSLSFPVRNGLSWDGNILNSQLPDTYEIDSLGVPYTIDGLITANSLTVVQEDLLDFVILEEDRRYEVYLQGVGLVEKSIRQLDLCSGGGCGPDGIESGIVYMQKAIGYGKE